MLGTIARKFHNALIVALTNVASRHPRRVISHTLLAEWRNLSQCPPAHWPAKTTHRVRIRRLHSQPGACRRRWTEPGTGHGRRAPAQTVVESAESPDPGDVPFVSRVGDHRDIASFFLRPRLKLWFFGWLELLGSIPPCAKGGNLIQFPGTRAQQGFQRSTLVGDEVARKCYLQPPGLDLFFSASSSGGGLPGRP